MTVKTSCTVSCNITVPVTSDSWSDAQSMEQVIREAKSAAMNILGKALNPVGARVLGNVTVVVRMEIDHD